MKLPKDRRKNHHHGSRRMRQSNKNDAVTEMLKLCLRKVCELQADLERSEEEADPEAAGYAACAMETLRFLTAQGVPPDHPIFKNLHEKLMGGRT